jgi:uncharacterized protein DUF3175
MARTTKRKSAGKSGIAAKRKAAAGRKSGARGKSAAHRRSTPRRGARKWSQRVTERSDALDLERGVFKLRSPGQIAASLKRSAERSRRRKAGPYRSALSMLTFYINRAGRNLSVSRKKVLKQAKDELRRQFSRDRPHVQGKSG